MTIIHGRYNFGYGEHLLSDSINILNFQEKEALMVTNNDGLTQKQTSLSDRPTTEDLLGFKQFTVPIAKRISNLTDKDTPLTIGIFGEWGSGKTSFLKMVDRELSDEYNISPIWFNAWKYDKEENLWSALLQCILNHTKVS